jgi:hypothetical protein
MNDAMTCRDLVELVTDYLEETIGATDRARFEQHLQGCEQCSIYLSQMRLTIRLTGRLTEETISEEAADELLHAFRSWKQRA